MDNSRTVWLARHGLREDFVNENWAATASRPHDPPLAREGRIQARENGAFLYGKGVEVIYCSPFLRTVETAGGIAEVLNVPIRIEYGMAEVYHPEWFDSAPELLDPAELQRRFPTIDGTYSPRVFPQYPEHEAAGDVDVRCAQAVDAVLSDPWTCALWIGHGASVGGLARGLVGDVEGVCFRMCGLTAWTGTPGNWTMIHSGADHLSYNEDEIRFH